MGGGGLFYFQTFEVVWDTCTVHAKKFNSEFLLQISGHIPALRWLAFL